MNARVTSIRVGPAATAVVRISTRPVAGKSDSVEVIQQHEPRPIAALLSHVLARYGILDPNLGGEQPRQLDLFA